jgi:hypothetical protein
MKKIYFLAAALTLTAVTAKAQTNLIINGDFENWTATNPENFEAAGTTVLYNDLLTKETTISQSGNAVKQQTKAVNSTQYLEYGDLIPVIPGHSYTISYWYLDNDNKARTRLWSTWLNSSNSGTTLNQDNIQLDDYSVDGSAWVHKTYTVTAPEGAAKIRYQIRAYHQDNVGGGFIYYDNLSFVDNSVAGTNDNTIEGLQMFPNPLSDNMLNIASSTNAEMNVAIYDMLGKQVINSKVSNGTVDVANLSAGIYVVTITEEGKTATRKLIKK